MKLSDYAKQMGVRYETAWRWSRDGKIQGRRIGPHPIIITEGQEEPQSATSQHGAISARVSSAEKKSPLDRQAERLVAYCAARGYQVAQVVKSAGGQRGGVRHQRCSPAALGAACGSGHRRDGGGAQGPLDALRLSLSGHPAHEPGARACGGEPSRERDRGFARRSDGHGVLVLRAALWSTTGQAQNRGDRT